MCQLFGSGLYNVFWLRRSMLLIDHVCFSFTEFGHHRNQIQANTKSLPVLVETNLSSSPLGHLLLSSKFIRLCWWLLTPSVASLFHDIRSSLAFHIHPLFQHICIDLIFLCSHRWRPITRRYYSKPPTSIPAVVRGGPIESLDYALRCVFVVLGINRSGTGCGRVDFSIPSRPVCTSTVKNRFEIFLLHMIIKLMSYRRMLHAIQIDGNNRASFNILFWFFYQFVTVTKFTTK